LDVTQDQKKMARIGRILPILLLLCQAALAADPSVTFPLQGYFRAGRYMPVHIRADESRAQQRLSLLAEGVVPTVIETGGSLDSIVPWLVVRNSVTEIHLTIDGHQSRAVDVPLHALADDEALVGFAGADVDALKPMLADRKIIGIPLDLGQPLPGPIVAWEALDGLVLDASSAARVTEAQLQGLLAAGIAVAIRSATRPAGNWLWQRQGEYWVLRCPIAGPDVAYDPDAYAPTASWSRGWPEDFRRLALLGAIVFSIVASALSLWRSRVSIVVVLVLCVSVVVAMLIWRERRPATIRTGGDVIVASREFAQLDRWTYCGIIRSADGVITFTGLTRPILGYRTQIDQTGLQLLCAPDGSPQQFTFHLEPGWSLAFLTRSVSADRLELPASNPVYSPLLSLAEQQYMRQGDHVLGQLPAAEPNWPSVVIER